VQAIANTSPLSNTPAGL